MHTRFLHTDHQGSVVAVADCFGNRIAVDAYDEYGIPGSGNIGRFQYTGQAWIPELGMYYYKARIYSPTLGRFLQTDPIGYDDQNNLYAYVGNDPVNNRDPSGLACTTAATTDDGKTVTVTGPCPPVPSSGSLTTKTGTRVPPPPVAQTPQSKEAKVCPSTTSVAARIANLADKISLDTGSVAIASGIAGLATAPTGAGFVGFESVALVAGAVSTGASIVGSIAHAYNGNVPGALMDAGGVIGGSIAGRLATRSLASTRMFGNLSASQDRTVKLVTNATGTNVGAASSLYSCN